jgi:hypothetical protein
VNIVSVGSQGSRTTADRAALLTPELREAARVEANAWIKRLRLVRYGTESMRERFTYKGDSLWWFTELYLHKMRRLDVAVDTILALGAARDAGAARLVVEDADAAGRAAAIAFGRAHGVPVDVQGASEPAPHDAQSLLVGWTGWLSRLRASRAPKPSRRPAVTAFIHSAFWRSEDPQEETYVGPVLDALIEQSSRDDVAFVGLGPRRNFRVRRWWDPLTAPGPSGVTTIERFASASAIQGSERLWKERHQLARALTSGDEIRAAAVVRGCDLWPVLQHELEGAALVQWPWSARTMDEAAAALEVMDPRVVVTYAEAGAWGRALVLEARRRGVPSVGLQHGFIYRHWLNYLHEADEMAAAGNDRGFPRPDQTLLYDRCALEHLTSAGNFPASSLCVTGSARLEALINRLAGLRGRREELRRAHGVAQDQRLAILTAKFTEIQGDLPALVEGAGRVPGLRLLIKPHPAETPALYAPTASGQAHVTVSPAADLAELLAAADVIVTMNSTVAVDGLVLGIPALAVGLPNNLSPFVDEGVMLGANGAEKIRQALESVLYDRQVQAGLKERAGAFAARYGLAPAPGSAARAAAEILAAAAR